MPALQLSEGLLKELLPLLEEYDQNTACQLVGIDYTTLYRWRMKGKKQLKKGEDTIYTRVWLQTQKARGTYKKPVIDSVRREALAGNPASQKMWLQSSDRKTWGDRVELNQEIDAFLQRLKENLPEEVYLQVLEAAEE